MTDGVDAMGRLAAVPVRLSVEVGSASTTLAALMALAPDAVIALDRAADAPLDILANGALIARGEVVMADGRYAIRVTEVAGHAPLPAIAA